MPSEAYPIESLGSAFRLQMARITPHAIETRVEWSQSTSRSSRWIDTRHIFLGQFFLVCSSRLPTAVVTGPKRLVARAGEDRVV
jgi:hypothetical protein